MTLRETVARALEELPEDRLTEVLNFIGYLQWRDRDLDDQTWFWSSEWQERYRQAKQDLSEGKYKEFDDVEALIQELKS